MVVIHQRQRLESRFTADAQFSPALAPSQVSKLLIQPDGMILAAGRMRTEGIGWQAPLMRLRPDGTRDTGLRVPRPPSNAGVVCSAESSPSLQPDSWVPAEDIGTDAEHRFQMPMPSPAAPPTRFFRWRAHVAPAQ